MNGIPQFLKSDFSPFFFKAQWKKEFKGFSSTFFFFLMISIVFLTLKKVQLRQHQENTTIRWKQRNKNESYYQAQWEWRKMGRNRTEQNFNISLRFLLTEGISLWHFCQCSLAHPHSLPRNVRAPMECPHCQSPFPPPALLCMWGFHSSIQKGRALLTLL